jgi:predicted GIY-YIG superfamily endonuclease
MEEFENKQAAQRREWAIKKLTRAQKEQLVSFFVGGLGKADFLG